MIIADEDRAAFKHRQRLLLYHKPSKHVLVDVVDRDLDENPLKQPHVHCIMPCYTCALLVHHICTRLERINDDDDDDEELTWRVESRGPSAVAELLVRSILRCT